MFYALENDGFVEDLGTMGKGTGCVDGSSIKVTYTVAKQSKDVAAEVSVTGGGCDKTCNVKLNGEFGEGKDTDV